MGPLQEFHFDDVVAVRVTGRVRSAEMQIEVEDNGHGDHPEFTLWIPAKAWEDNEMADVFALRIQVGDA